MCRMKTMIAFMIPGPQKQMYLDIQKRIFDEYGGVPLKMPPHITLKIPIQKDPEELNQIFSEFRFPKFTIERNQFYRFGDRVAYDGLIRSNEWIHFQNEINKALEEGGVTLKADDKDRVPHITIAKSKGKGIYNLPAYLITKKLNAEHHDFKPIKVSRFTICKKTEKGWKKHADIVLS